MGIRDIIKSLDFFGFSPTFRIDGKDALKSFLSGFATLIFLLLAIGYFLYNVNNYLSNIDRVMSSRRVSLKAPSYNLTTFDLTYGIGIVDSNGETLNFSDYNYLKPVAYYIFFNRTSDIEISTPINLIPCTIEHFIPKVDLNLFNKNSLNILNSKIPLYFCPEKNYTFYFGNSDFVNDKIHLEFSISLNENIDLVEASNKISTLRPIFSLLYQDYIINSDNRQKPYIQTVGEFQNQIGFPFSKQSIITVYPANILDDNNPIASGDFSPLSLNIYSSQKDGTIFPSVRSSDYFRYLINRESVKYDDTHLVRFNVELSSTIQTTYRTYRKFTEFVASVTSMISNVLLIFGIILIKINSIKGMNNMIKSLFNISKINEIKELNTNFQTISQKLNYNNDKGNQKGNKKQIQNLKKSQIRANKQLESLKYKDVEELGSDFKKLGTDVQLKQTNEKKIEEKFDDIINDLKFNFTGYLKIKCFCKKKKTGEIFENAIHNVEKMMDINQYIAFKFDMDMIKEVVLDKYQKSAFELMTNLINFNTLFKYKKSEKLKKTVTTAHEDLIFPLKKIYKRRNEMDEKIIHFFKDVLGASE